MSDTTNSGNDGQVLFETQIDECSYRIVGMGEDDVIVESFSDNEWSAVEDEVANLVLIEGFLKFRRDAIP